MSRRPTPPLRYNPSREWAVLNAGGTVRGAANVTAWEQHIAEYGYPDAVAGTSIGAENIIPVSQGEVEILRPLYEGITGVGSFQRPNLAPWNILRLHRRGGFFNFKPLRKLLEQHADVRKVEIPSERVFFQVCDMETMRGRSISKVGAIDNDHYIQMALASSAQPVIHEYERLYIPELGRKVICCDGGLQDPIPYLPEWWKYRNIRVLLTSPVDRHTIVQAKDVDGWGEVAGRAFDWLMATVIERNMVRLRRWADYGVNVTVHAPGSDIGGAFDASPEMISKRLGPIGDLLWLNGQRL